MTEGAKWAEEFARGIREKAPEAEAAARELGAAVERAMLEQARREQEEHEARTAKQRRELDDQLEKLRVEIIGDPRGWERALGVRQTCLRSVMDRLFRRRNK
jgi:hypothetical protein